MLEDESQAWKNCYNEHTDCWGLSTVDPAITKVPWRPSQAILLVGVGGGGGNKVADVSDPNKGL